MGIVDIAFQSAGTGKYATPTGHFNFHFAPLAVSYKLSHSEIKDNWISSRSNLTVHFGKSPRELLPEKEQLSGHYEARATLHGARDLTLHSACDFKHLAEQLLVLQTCISHHALVEGGKDKTERCC